MKKKLLLPLIFACIFSLSLCGCGLNANTYADAASYTAGDGQIAQDWASVTEIDIKWIAGDVRVAYADTDEIAFSETAGQALSDEETMRWWKDGRTLKIHFAKSGYRTDNVPQKSLLVTLPKAAKLNELEIESVSADVSVAEIAVVNLDVETVSGDVALSAAISGKADIATVSGELAATLRTLPVEFDIDTVSGDSVLSLPAEAAFTAELETVSGNFFCEFSEPVKTGKKYTVNQTGTMTPGRIDAETVSGSLEILKTGA